MSCTSGHAVESKKKGVDETVGVKRRRVNPFLDYALEKFSQEEDSGGCGNSWSDNLGDSCGLSGLSGVSGCVPDVESGVPVVTDVLVSPSSSMGVMSEALIGTAAVCVENQEDINYGGTLVKARSRRLRLCSCKLRWRIRKPAVKRS